MTPFHVQMHRNYQDVAHVRGASNPHITDNCRTQLVNYFVPSHILMHRSWEDAILYADGDLTVDELLVRLRRLGPRLGSHYAAKLSGLIDRDPGLRKKLAGRDLVMLENWRRSERVEYAFSEADHPREPAGSPDGGQFASEMHESFKKTGGPKSGTSAASKPEAKPASRAKEANAKYKELLAQAKAARTEAFAAAKTDAQAAQQKVGERFDAIHEHGNNLAWDTDKHAIYNELEELIMDYDHDWSASDRYAHLREIETKAKEAKALKQEATDDLPAEYIKENQEHLVGIIASAQQARQHLKTYIHHRRDMAAIKSGEQVDYAVAMHESWERAFYYFDPHEPRDKAGRWTAGANAGGQHETADSVAKGAMGKAKSLPAATVSKIVSVAKGIYDKAEAKYGPGWAKAILATAIVTMPTPFTTPAVLAVTGLAHVWTKFAKQEQPAKYADDSTAGPSEDEINAIAAEWCKQLLAAAES